ncbi:MAG: YncE family protein, partial [Pseudomonadota bacterium]
TIYIASAGDGTVRRFKAQDFTEMARTNLGDDADRIRIDPASNEVLVGYGAGGLAVRDEAIAGKSGSNKQTQNKKSGGSPRRGKTGTEGQGKRERAPPGIHLPAHPEGFQLDAQGRRIFVNLAGLDEVGVIDRPSGKMTGLWRAPGLRANFPMAIAEPGKRVLVVYRRPSRLVAFTADSGSVAAMLDVCRDPDDIFVDAKRRRIYVMCGEGVVDVLEQDGTGYRRIGRVSSAPEARTGLYVPERDRLYAAAPAMNGEVAAVLVFRPLP